MDSGPGTLRYAILAANTTPGPDDIGFDLATVGNTIKAETNLPAVTDTVTISSPVRIALTWVPTNAPVGFEALNIRADDVRISNLSITGFEHGAFLHDGSDRAVISDNYFGVAPDGETAPGGMFHGVRIAASTNNLIENNVIAGCSRESVWVESPDASGSVIRGNKIGTNAAGTVALSNLSDGIHLGIGSHDNTVIDNLISGNGGSGVRISGDFGFAAHHNVFQRNRIGTDVTGTLPLPNGGNGIAIVGGANTNTIGGREAGVGNTIAFNTQSGVFVVGAGASANTIVGNSIRSNGLLGIDLGGDGVTPNDTLDADSGPNGLLNFPVLTAALPEIGNSTGVEGVFDGDANRTVVLDFYASPASGSQGRREGARHLGSLTVTTDSLGHGSFVTTLLTSVAQTDLVTATATNDSGSTSEFSIPILTIDTQPLPLHTPKIVAGYEYIQTVAIDLSDSSTENGIYPTLNSVNKNDYVKVIGTVEYNKKDFAPSMLIGYKPNPQQFQKYITVIGGTEGVFDFQAESDQPRLIVEFNGNSSYHPSIGYADVYVKKFKLDPNPGLTTNLSIVNRRVARNADGGIHFDYQVDAEGVPAEFTPTVSVYLAAADGSKIGDPLLNRLPLAKTPKGYPVDISGATVKAATSVKPGFNQFAPFATQFLVEIDGAGVSERSTDDNRATLSLPNIEALRVRRSGNTVVVKYRISGNNDEVLPDQINPDVTISWGNQIALLGRESRPKVINKNKGTWTISFPLSQLGRRPAGATGIYALFTGIGESNVTDNLTYSGVSPVADAKGTLTAYRPVNPVVNYANFPVPKAMRDKTGVGIRVNGDDDNQNDIPDYLDTSSDATEDDLLPLDYRGTGLTPKTELVLSIASANIRVWGASDKSSPLKTSEDAFGKVVHLPSSSGRVWIEWVGNSAGKASLTLQVRDRLGEQIRRLDSFELRTFASNVIVLGGANSPINTNVGLYALGVKLYESGYDVHIFNYSTAANALMEATSAIRDRRVNQLAIFGHSKGGGATYDIIAELNAIQQTIGDFTVPYAAYVDAIATGFTASAETRRPSRVLYFQNYYQTYADTFAFRGESVVNSELDLNVNKQSWGINLRHRTIDDSDDVRGRILNAIKRRVMF